MSVQTGEALGVCNLLLEDPDLAEAVPGARREEVAQACTVPEVRVPPGEWTEQSLVPGDGVGMIVLEGLLIRRVGIDGRFGAEILGRSDVLWPWPNESEQVMLPLSSQWVVQEHARLALLDDRFARLFARYPKLAARLLCRAVRRSRHLTVNMAIVNQARVDVRLHMLFWHLAGRFGRVRGDGIAVPLRLTHTVLAELVAARRPTVTTALSLLAKDGRVRLLDNAWLLSGDPPGELGRVERPAAIR